VLAKSITTTPRLEEVMSILFVLLTFLIILAMNYFYLRAPQAEVITPEVLARPAAPVMAKEYGFSIPQGYSFHPGHTWVMREGGENARVGLDSFAADLAGKIDHIEVIAPSRWVRQGQRLMTVHAGDVSFDLMSPAEGVVMAVNNDVVKDPMLAIRDPYKDGWIAMLKSPDLSTNQKNLLQGSMVAPWMHYNLARLNAAITKMNPALAQDGGLPLTQVLTCVGPEIRRKLIKDFFLN
jgi:glycine cleavage system H protein